MKFGEKLKAIRKERKITQDELAKIANISRKTLTNYETGARYPKSQETYALLAKALDVSEEEIRDDDDSFITEAKSKYGYRGEKDAQVLVSQISGLFAGGEVTEETKDEVMLAIQKAYWAAKEENVKYTPKKYRKDSE